MPLPLNSSVIDILGPTPTAAPRPKPRPSTSKPSKLASSTTSKPQTQHQQPSAAASASPHRHADLSVGSTRDDPIILSPELSPVPLPPPEEASHPTLSSSAADDSGVSLPGRVEVSKTSGSPEDDARPNNTSVNGSSTTHLPTAKEPVAGQSFSDVNATATSQGQPRGCGSASGAEGGARSAGEATRCLAQTSPPPPRPSQPASGGSGGDDHHDGRVSQLRAAGRELDRSASSTAAQQVVPRDSHGTVDSVSSSSSSSLPAPAQPSQPTFETPPHPTSGRYTGAGEARLPSTTTVSQPARTSNAADEGGQRSPPTLHPTTAQLPQALTNTAMGNISAAAPAAFPHSLTGRVAGDDLPSLAPPSTRSSPLSDESASEYEEENSTVATTPAGVPLWTASEDANLLSIIQRNGIRWKAVELDFNKFPSGTYRSIRALRHRWVHLRNGKSTPQLTAAKRAAEASPRTRRGDAWTDAENQVLLQGMADGKTFAVIYADYKRKFGRSKRTRSAMRARFHRLKEGGHAGGQENEGEEEGEEDGSDGQSQEGKGDVDSSQDIDMDELPSTSGLRLTQAGQYMWTDEDDQVLFASVARYRTQCIDWPRVEKRYNRHCAIQRSKPALQARWHTIKDKQPRQGQQQQQARQQHASAGRGVGREGGQGSSTSRPLSHHRISPMGSQIQDSQTSLVGSLEHSSINAFSPPPTTHQPTATARAPLSSFASTTAKAPQHAQHLNSILDTLSLSVDYEPNGVRISNVIPGLEVKVFSRKSVKLSLPDPSSSSCSTAPSSSFEEQPAFHLKVLSDGSVQAVRSPPGASLGAGLARKEDGGMGTVARCVGVDGFSVSLSS